MEDIQLSPQTPEIDALLEAWALRHVQEQPEDIRLINPEADSISDRVREAIKPETAHVEGDPQSHSVIADLATKADGRFPKLWTAVEEQETETDIILSMGEALESGRNVVLMVKHRTLAALGFTAAAYLVALKQRSFEFRSSVIIGKMPPRLAQRVGEDYVPIVDTLSLGFNDIYMGYPDTQSTAEAGIPRHAVMKLGVRMVRHFNPGPKRPPTTWTQGGNFLVIDPTGTTRDTLEVSDATKGLLNIEGVTSPLVTFADTVVNERTCRLRPGGRLYSIDAATTPEGTDVDTITKAKLWENWEAHIRDDRKPTISLAA